MTMDKAIAQMFRDKLKDRLMEETYNRLKSKLELQTPGMRRLNRDCLMRQCIKQEIKGYTEAVSYTITTDDEYFEEVEYLQHRYKMAPKRLRIPELESDRYAIDTLLYAKGNCAKAFRRVSQALQIAIPAKDMTYFQKRNLIFKEENKMGKNTYYYKLIATYNESDDVIKITNSQHTGKQWASEQLLHGDPNADYVELWAVDERTGEERWLDTYYAKDGDYDYIHSAMEPVQYVDTDSWKEEMWYMKEQGGMI